MRTIEFGKIVETVEGMCISAACELPRDVYAAVEAAAKSETNPMAAGILEKLLENARIAEKERIPLCQDTGLTVVFVEQGSEVLIESKKGKTLTDAINEGVAAGYEKGYLRKSVVAEPLNQRKNTGTNTPAVIHYTIVPGDRLKLTLMLKGGGSENKSQFRVFNPTAEKGQIADWVVDVVKQAGANACPPFVVGIGIGGDFELCCCLSKKALLRKIGESHPDKFYGELEREIFDKINSLGLGPLGFGGDTTALACFIETAPCHIASLPAAVNIECHSHRHKSVVI
ncbi:MAG: fumarate hydratase [Candidatus Brocadiia bacterium]|nr:MAG: fumarate hydratase [Candidatus Brocadiia bacterium]